MYTYTHKPDNSLTQHRSKGEKNKTRKQEKNNNQDLYIKISIFFPPSNRAVGRFLTSDAPFCASPGPPPPPSLLQLCFISTNVTVVKKKKFTAVHFKNKQKNPKIWVWGDGRFPPTHTALLYFTGEFEKNNNNNSSCGWGGPGIIVLRLLWDF